MTPDEQWIAKYRAAIDHSGTPAKSSLASLRKAVAQSAEFLLFLLARFRRGIENYKSTADNSAPPAKPRTSARKKPRRAEQPVPRLGQRAASTAIRYGKRAG
jgi:hypothetical protein